MPQFSMDSLRKMYTKWALQTTNDFLNNELLGKPSFLQDNLEGQLTFMWDYIIYPHRDGIKQKVIQELLNNQKSKRDRSMYLIQLEGGYPVSVFVSVKELREFDLEDAHRVTDFTDISIHNKHNRKWTAAGTDNMIEQVKEDLEFEGGTAMIVSNVQGHILNLIIKIKET